MNLELSPIEARVLGSLIEKDVTTPEYYPLSLNALVNACNQKTSREPVMTLDEGTAREALASLDRHGLAGQSRSSEGRVAKFEHRLQEVFNFTRAETAVICLLLLRGPQTPGELRGRSERLFHFQQVDDVISTLQRLTQRETPLVAALPRHPGTKETRYAHLFCGESIEASEPSLNTADSATHEGGRIALLEQEVENLKQQVADLMQQFAEFRRQFE